jgi:anti-sigma regulatory factor (Ser/Thr protein kinase)
MSNLAPPDGYQDDVVLLLYRQPASLEMEFPADADHLAHARTTLRDWLSRAGVNPQQAMNVLVAAGEAIANGIEHGYRHGSDGTIRVTATALADQVQLAVTDSGSWRSPPAEGGSNRGRGIALMRELTDDLVITRNTAGTAVHLSVRII